MKRFFLFIGNLAASIVENVSTQAEEQPLCKTYTRRSELFLTCRKVSDEIKPHNKKQEIPHQSLMVLTFLLSVCGKRFLFSPPPPPPPSTFFFLLPLKLSRNNSIGNACYAGYDSYCDWLLFKVLV